MSFLNTSNQTQSAGASSLLGTQGAGTSAGASSTSSNLSTAQTDSAFADMLKGDDDPQSILKDMTSGGMQGYWSYQIKQMKQKVAEDTLQSKGLTEADVANMPPDQRADLERTIMREVEQKVRQMTNADKNGKTGLLDSGGQGAATTGQAAYGAQAANANNQTGAHSGVPIAGGDTLQGILSTQEMQN